VAPALRMDSKIFWMIFVAGQLLKIKGSTPSAALSEAMEYLVQNTFSKMGYLKHLSTEPLKELQAILRSNDTAKETALLLAGENNPEALDDLRNYLRLSSVKSQQVILHDMLEKRYSLRPYGWPEDEVLLLLARLVVLGEVTLMMDGSLLPVERVYEAITAPAKRRKIVVRKRETADPKSIQDARALGKDLFAEMGPDGEDALFGFLQARLKGWQVTLSGFRQLADTGSYPGSAEIAEALALLGPLLADAESRKFIERFNGLKADLVETGDQFHELDHFYNHQKPTWERLRKFHATFQLNRLELERNEKAGPALRRMQEILVARSPYALIKEVDGLIDAVGAVNASLLMERRCQAIEKIDGYIKTLDSDLTAANGDAALRAACLNPIEALRSQVEKQESLAHITQAESETVKEFDLAQARIEEFLRKTVVPVAPKGPPGDPPGPKVKRQRIVKPADLVGATYLETSGEVDQFLGALRQELEDALAKNERIQIR
jgi:hypothetical protein